MKKIIALILSLMMLCAACPVPAEGNSEFATFGDAVAAAGENPAIGGNEDYMAVVVEKDGKYIRVVTELDEKAKKLDEEAMEAEDIDAAIQVFDEYVRTLPVAYTEEFTAPVKEQAELDSLAGKTIEELEETGYEYAGSGTEGNENTIVFMMAYGLYNYDFVVDSDFDDYMKRQENDEFDDLVVKSGKFSGVSIFATDLNYHADGTVEEAEEDDSFLMTLDVTGEDGDEESSFLLTIPEDAVEIEDEDAPRDASGLFARVDGNKKPGLEEDGLPEYEYSGTDEIEGAIADALAAGEIGGEYLTEPGCAAVPCPLIFKTEMTDDTHAKVYGDFWVLYYVLEGTTLKCISGGECPGAVTLEKEDDIWSVVSADIAEDGEHNAESIERIAGGDKDLIAQFGSRGDMGEEVLKSVREKYLKEYIESNDLDVDAYQDEGWDPVPLK